MSICISTLIDYENGELSDSETIKLFSHLIKTEMIWRLQGSYAPKGKALRDAGFLLGDGSINYALCEERGIIIQK
jgi:hypothetical protein